MSERPLDLRRVLAVLARGKSVLVVWVLLGTAVATAAILASPPRHSATTLVLLSPSETDGSGKEIRSIDTEIEIASSAEVLAIASRNLDPVPDIAELKDAVKVAEATADILRISGFAGSPSRAIAIANASADAYREYKAAAATALMEKVVSQLQARAEQLQQQITAVQAELEQAIAALATTETNSPAAVAQTSLIDSLRIQENEATTQLTDAQNQITQAQLEADVNTAGITVLERASAASQGITRTALLKLVFGAIAGFLIGVAILTVRDSRDRRVRLRDDIAAAAGAPVVASIATRRPRNASEWRALLENYEPSADESWSLRRVLRGALTADGTSPVHLTVVTLPSDTDAVALGPQIAAFAAASGVETLLVIVGRDPAIASLRQACDDANGSPERTPWRGRRRPQAGRRVRTNLSIVGAMPSEFEDLTAPQLIVTAAVADVPTLDDEGHASIAMIGVTAGVATPERIAAAAAASAGRQPIAGVIIANPDPHDGTAGRVHDHPRTNPLPNRVGSARRGAAS
ncbi:MAG: Wzz/FepE/Etk N-terminal domain-containing protein [Acidimicrobiia bacterium]